MAHNYWDGNREDIRQGDQVAEIEINGHRIRPIRFQVESEEKKGIKVPRRLIILVGLSKEGADDPAKMDLYDCYGTAIISWDIQGALGGSISNKTTCFGESSQLSADFRGRMLLESCWHVHKWACEINNNVPPTA